MPRRVVSPDQEEAEREAVWAEALTWQGTPYHHRAAVKGQGVDCARLPIAVYAAVGVVEPFDPGQYSPQWHLHQERQIYLAIVRRFAGQIAREEARKGDFVLWKFGHTFSHGAILGDPPQIIHATILGRCVHLGDMDRDDDLAQRDPMFFSLWKAPDDGR